MASSPDEDLDDDFHANVSSNEQDFPSSRDRQDTQHNQRQEDGDLGDFQENVSSSEDNISKELHYSGQQQQHGNSDIFIRGSEAIQYRAKHNQSQASRAASMYVEPNFEENMRDYFRYGTMRESSRSKQNNEESNPFRLEMPNRHSYHGKTTMPPEPSDSPPLREYQQQHSMLFADVMKQMLDQQREFFETMTRQQENYQKQLNDQSRLFEIERQQLMQERKESSCCLL